MRYYIILLPAVVKLGDIMPAVILCVMYWCESENNCIVKGSFSMKTYWEVVLLCDDLVLFLLTTTPDSAFVNVKAP